jgi:hypothetical protein
VSPYVEAGYTAALVGLASYGAVILVRERRTTSRLRSSGAVPPRQPRRAPAPKVKPEDLGD